MKISFSQLLSNRFPIIFDGAMGTELQKHQAAISLDDYQGNKGCLEILSLTRPDILRDIHCGYLRAGAHVVETNSFGANRFKLAAYGMETRVVEMNMASARAAREAVEECTGRDIALVCGAMGPTGFLPSSSSAEQKSPPFDEIAAAFREQAAALLDGGVDILLLETMQDLLEVRAAMYGMREEFRERGGSVPVMVQVTMDPAGHMLLGSDVRAFLGAVANLSPTVVGFNCSTGPDEMVPHVKALCAQGPCAVSVIPNAGMPENVDGVAHYRMDPASFADKLASMVLEHGVSVVGGCCGTGREHIARLAQLLDGARVARRACEKNMVFLGSGISGLGLHSAKRPIVIGERLNAQGSKKTKDLVLARKYEEMVRVAQEQHAQGASVLDLSMAINERDDEADTMVAVVRYLSERLGSAFCIDSTDAQVFEKALRCVPGSALINSINLEKNGEKARRILSLARDFGCPLIALPIDDRGMAKEVERKLELAGKLREIACEEFGLSENRIFFDPLVFTLATGERAMANAAVESLEALREMKQRYPSMRTVMGVSNVSFGLKPRARRIINNLLLHHAVDAGLDAAIFNPLHLDDVGQYEPKERVLAENLLFNRHDRALEELVEYFEKLQPPGPGPSKPKPAQTAALAPEQELRQRILDRDRRNVKELIEKLLQSSAATAILNGILLPAMAEVGKRMARGEMILPFVLQAAEVMKEAVGVLDPYFEKGGAAKKGKIVLATVYGDVHDIGKNLVGSILKNQGYDVVDLGKQVPLEEIVSAVKKEKPDAVGLSALLVTTSREMAEAAREFDRQGITVPVLIGGAAVNRQFAERISWVEERECPISNVQYPMSKEEGTASGAKAGHDAALSPRRQYAGGVYYGKDAFEAAKLLELFRSTRRVQGSGFRVQSAASGQQSAVSGQESAVSGQQSPVTSHQPPKVEHGGLLTPMFYGTSDMLTWDTSNLLDGIDRRKLYKGYWRTGRMSGEEFERNVLTEFDPAFEVLRKEIIGHNRIDARGYYGIWPVYAEAETVYFLDPSNFSSEVAQFTFPRTERKNGRSIADWVRPDGDVVGVQVVTIGGALAERCREYFEKEDRYSLGFYLNGIGNYVTEDLAEKVTREVRRAMYIQGDARGTRYGLGYPGLPGLEKQKVLLELLCAEERLGITLTTGFQMVPEHSTATIFIHHPDSQYLQ